MLCGVIALPGIISPVKLVKNGCSTAANPPSVGLRHGAEIISLTTQTRTRWSRMPGGAPGREPDGPNPPDFMECCSAPRWMVSGRAESDPPNLFA
jgi:hypothetical protein